MPEFGSYDPSDWGWQHGDAATIVPFTFDGHVFPAGVAAGTVPYFAAALDILCAQPGFSLPTSRDLDAGMWGYEDRTISGSSNYSFHAYGLAIDIAAPWNPSGADPPDQGPHRLPSNTGDLLSGLGFEWGGNWPGSIDWMHVELHRTPADVAAGAGLGLPPGPLPPGGPAGPFPLPAGHYFGPYEGPEESISGSGSSDAQWRPFLQLAQRAIGAPADGFYGPITAAATREWQRAHALQDDGLIGPLTWATFPQ